MDWDVIVVGAGPSGCFTAKLIADFGFKVLILEEHEQVGEPVQCAGLVSPRAMELAGATDKIIINRLTDLRVFSPLGTSLCLNSSRNHVLAIDRAEFDRHLAAKAEEEGVNLLTGAKANGLQRIAGGFRVAVLNKNNTEMTMDTRLIIGADGSFSKVARWLELKNANPRAVMFAADVELQCSDTNRIDVFLGRSLAPGWFGWVIPLDKNTCRVGSGFAIEKQGCSPEYFFKQIVKKHPQYFSGLKVLRYTGGSVPIGLSKIYTQHAMLVGDAACQTKPISGGGIYMGLRGAQLCAQVAVKALLEDDLSEESLSLYQILWEKEMKEEIICGMRHRESFLDLSDEDMEFLIKFLNQPILRKIIIKYGDTDYPSKLAKRLFSLKPWNQGFFKVAMKIAGYDFPLAQGKNIIL